MLILAVAAAPSPIKAQEDAPLVVPFAQFPPFLFLDEGGQRSGFMVDLAEMIGAEIGVPIDYFDVANAGEWIGAQASGQAQLIPGVLKLPLLQATNVFSNDVAADVLRPAVRADDQDLIASGVLKDRRIAIVPPAVGSEEPILNQNTPVQYESPQDAVIDLLSGKVDAVLLPSPVIYRLARDAGFDGRIAFVGDPLHLATRHVALHESRAELLPEINAAIARMEADGRLEALRERYAVVVPPAPPEVLTVGVTHFPPFLTIEADGEVSGFFAEAFEDLSKRAKLSFSFEEVDVADYVRGPSAAGVDALPAIVEIAALRGAMDFTTLVRSEPISLVTSTDDTRRFQSIEDLRGLRVGVLEGGSDAAIIIGANVADVVTYPSLDLLFGAISAGEIEVLATAQNTALTLVETRGLSDRFKVVAPPLFHIDTTIGLRPGLGAVRERLNAVIPGYLLSDDYAALVQKYFGRPVFWTPARVFEGLVAIGVVVLFLVTALLIQRHHQRQLAFERQQAELVREQAHAQELGKLINELQRSNRDLDEFAYTASHDLKEPLRGIAINANFLSREALSENGQELVARMVTLTKRMEQLIADLLFFSRLGRTQDKLQSIDPAGIIDGIVEDLAEWLAERNASVDIVSELPEVRADPLKLKTVFQNLIVNGLKYNNADAKLVEIGFRPAADVDGADLRNVFFVRDNGIGIADEDHDKVFDIFTRLNLDEEYGEGTGAGLSFVRKIIESNGGDVRFTSQPDVGTTFFVTLPMSKEN